jgi:ABC-type glycerol-3-phosphate transport system substrate-binding protein
MISARTFAVAVLAAAAGLAGCGEKEQVSVYHQGKYQGKPDTKPWENEPGGSVYTTSKWTKGDESSWETALKSRNQKQNEYTRVE